MDSRKIYFDSIKWIIGRKEGHKSRVSKPVIRLVGGKYYIAEFICHHTAEDYKLREISRPTEWICMDFEGNILRTYSTELSEFSDAPYNRTYCIAHIYEDMEEIEASGKLYDTAFFLFDSALCEIEKTGVMSDKAWLMYEEYLETVLKHVPEDYRRFYRELSIKRDKPKTSGGIKPPYSYD